MKQGDIWLAAFGDSMARSADFTALYSTKQRWENAISDADSCLDTIEKLKKANEDETSPKAG